MGTADAVRSKDAVPPVLLRSSEAARMLGVAEQTLRNWRSQGEGPRSVRRGALVRYRPDDVREWAGREFR
ncbi:helix-turn-helix domain-containing protein [Microbacterium paraoxydans]|uniref:helix-turn-helix domain-containing protein n=1 Tax=Microbacterium paraoxydans TaxID=199592 RepID=UPI0009DF5EFD|nr:helix-turn-helix domain-containing protein [Microbacterium paraoxydans]